MSFSWKTLLVLMTVATINEAFLAPLSGSCCNRLKQVNQQWHVAALNDTSTHDIFNPSQSNPLLEPETSIEAHNMLNQQALQDENYPKMKLNGCIVKRRALGSSLVFLDVQFHSDHQDERTEPLQALLRRDYWWNPDSFDIYHKILQPGTLVHFEGWGRASRNPGQALLQISRATLKRPNANPQHTRGILELLAQHFNDDEFFEEMAQTFQTSPEELRIMVQDCIKKTHGKPFMGLARTLLKSVSSHCDLIDSNKMMGSSIDQKVKLLPVFPGRIPDWILSKEGVAQHSLQAKNNHFPHSVKSITTLNETTEFVTMIAWVQNRRRYQNSITVLEVVDDFSAVSHNQSSTRYSVDWTKRLTCVLHPRLVGANAADMYGSILCSGARLMVHGYVSRCDDSRVKPNSAKSGLQTIWIQNVQLVRSSWRPRTVQAVVDYLYNGAMDMEEGSQALELTFAQAQELTSIESTTERQWKAAEISRTLQGSNTRVGSPFTPEMQQLLDKYQPLRETFPLTLIEPEPIPRDFQPAENEEKPGTEEFIPLRTSLSGSRWQRVKRPQLEWMLRQVQQVVEAHPAKRPLQILDVGGGKGHLASFLARQLGPSTVEVHVVDISSSAIYNGRMWSLRNRVSNIDYHVADASTSKSLDNRRIDIVVALHACGALSDVAMGHAVANEASFVICPCCYRSNPHLRVRLPSKDKTTTRLVSVAQWLGVNKDKDKAYFEQLKCLAEIQGDAEKATQACHSICALRAEAVVRHYDASTSRQMKVDLRMFPIGFSTKNLCLVGTAK